jgi:hypothetical protein
MGWVQVTMTNDEAHNQGKWQALQDGFERLFMSSGGPRKAAMFHKHDHKQNWFYFSPDAAVIFGPILQAFNRLLNK